MIDKVLLEKFRSNIEEAIRVIATNKMRTFLTALGIIFGVSAVITMLAIGKGAEKEILAQLELIGVNNIVVTPIADTEESDSEEEGEGQEGVTRFSKGLDLLDVQSILKNIPSVKTVSPEIVMDSYMIRNGRQQSVKLIGVTSDFFKISDINIERGKNFSERQQTNALPVCVIGKNVENKLFTGKDPIGKSIKVGNVWLQIIGVIEEKMISEEAQENLGIRNLNKDVYVPIKTFLVRFKDRKILVAEPLPQIQGGARGITVVSSIRSGQEQGPTKRIPRGNYHQIDKLTVQVSNSNELQATSEVVTRMLKRKHNNVVDFDITIPIQLLEQQQKTKQIFNIVLSIIAGISLLIGGIGIMNIMLASVLERTKEIGIMRAIGATRQDVVLQFLSESVLISLGGGILGVILGILASLSLEKISGIETVLTLDSIILSFFVATMVGLVFGIFPARSAANKKPIEAIRAE